MKDHDMTPMQTLMDMVRAKLGGSEASIARALKLSPQEWHELSSGKRPLSPELTAQLCDVLELPGEEAREWVARSMLANPKNSSKLDMLRRALFACWVLGVGPLCTLNDAEAKGAASVTGHYTNALGAYTSVTHALYIVGHWLASLIRTANSRNAPARPNHKAMPLFGFASPLRGYALRA